MPVPAAEAATEVATTTRPGCWDISPRTTRAIIALTGLLRLCVTLNCLALLVFNNCVQGQLAAIIDFGNLHFDLLAHLQDVLDVLNALATNQATDLRDVQQAILTRAQ